MWRLGLQAEGFYAVDLTGQRDEAQTTIAQCIDGWTKIYSRTGLVGAVEEVNGAFVYIILRFYICVVSFQTLKLYLPIGSQKFT